MRLLVINGPNLNLLGTRRPDVYGAATLGELEMLCRRWGAAAGASVDTFQSNHEGAIIDRLHEAIGAVDGIVINPGALTHYSYALHDAIEAVGIPTVEVHISDIAARESWRAQSVVSTVCASTISGEGLDGYRRAIEYLAHRAD
ncbi:MAG: type II 3-dehydroquinate dehydratase [Actinobacteria bacterium RBG_16_68_21]|nr:MAG: type II 3-dehydroquinate dehydratase [Actinobacteria bacterium RBG_16_68_21]